MPRRAPPGLGGISIGNVNPFWIQRGDDTVLTHFAGDWVSESDVSFYTNTGDLVAEACCSSAW